MDVKFTYGYDINVYLLKAVERIKDKYYYHWADLSMFNDQYHYAIEKDNEEYHFVRYTSFSDSTEKELLDVNPNNSWDLVVDADGFIDRIASDNEHDVFYANPKTLTYKLQVKPDIEVQGWHIEHYEFNRHKTGDYSVFVQAGDRLSGASRDFFIPPHFFEGSFEEFLDEYETLVPGDDFGLYKEDLINDEGLKRFLGLK